MNMKMLVLTLLSLLLTTAARSQQAMQVNWQARMNDSLTIGLRMTYDARLKAGERAKLADATVAKRVDCREEGGAVLGLSFSCDFEYHGLRYRLRGRYTDDPENTGSGHQSIQCIPLTLGRDIIEQGGYRPARH